MKKQMTIPLVCIYLAGVQIALNPSRKARTILQNADFGFQAVSLVGDQNSQPEPRPLCIRDFNLHRVADFKAGNCNRWNQRPIEGRTLIQVYLWSHLDLIFRMLRRPLKKSAQFGHGSKQGDVDILRFRGGLTMPKAGEQSFVEYEVVRKSIQILDLEQLFTSSFM
jgi:hypothetical protein